MLDEKERGERGRKAIEMEGEGEGEREERGSECITIMSFLPLQYVMHMNVRQMDIFDVFQGIQFLPLDKYMYLKVHCFVNLIETTFRYVYYVTIDTRLSLTRPTAPPTSLQNNQENSDAL